MIVPNRGRVASARMSASMAEVEQALQAPCTCRDGAGTACSVRPDAATGPTTHSPHVAARLLRPVIRHIGVRTSMSAGSAHWNHLADGARVPLLVADRWIESMSQELQDPSLGVHALAELRRGDHGAVELAAESAPTLLRALQVIASQAQGMCDGLELHLHVSDGIAALVLRFAVRISGVVREFLLGTLAQGLRAWLGEPPDIVLWCSSRQRALPLGTPLEWLHVEFGASRDMMVFSADLLKAPLRKADPVLHAVLMRAVERGACSCLAPSSLADEVRRCLVSALPSMDCDIEAIAGLVGMSSRTLSRRLQREGTGFAPLLDEVRNQQARYYLEQSLLPIGLVAQRLGYSGTAAFCRAFVRWHGVAPTQYRSDHAALAF